MDNLSGTPNYTGIIRKSEKNKKGTSTSTKKKKRQNRGGCERSEQQKESFNASYCRQVRPNVGAWSVGRSGGAWWVGRSVGRSVGAWWWSVGGGGRCTVGRLGGRVGGGAFESGANKKGQKTTKKI